MIIFINGIHTSYSEACEICEELESLVGAEVVLFHNPSITITTALLESVWNRMFSWVAPAPVTKKFSSFIDRALLDHPVIDIIAHSQGTAIANNAVSLLPHIKRRRINLSLFAPVNSFIVQGLARLDRFKNDKDYVISNLYASNWLIRMNRKRRERSRAKAGLPPLDKGNLYKREASGHSFLISYIRARHLFNKYEQSRLYQLTKEG